MTKKTTAALQIKLECSSAYFISVIASIKWFFFRPKLWVWLSHPLSTTLHDINVNIMDGKYIACKFSDIDISSPSYLHRMGSC